MSDQMSATTASTGGRFMGFLSSSEERRETKRQSTFDVEVPLTLLTFKGLTPVVLLSVVGQCGTTALLATVFTMNFFGSCLRP